MTVALQGARLVAAMISTAEHDRHLDLFRGVLGMEVVSEQVLSGSEARALWAVDARSARVTMLTTPPSYAGVALVEFDPASEVVIREGMQGIDTEALKVIDVVTSDAEAGFARFEEAGFVVSDVRSSYEIEDGAVTETHAYGPEEVVIGILDFHTIEASRFVELTDRLFSEAMSISVPVDDLEPVVEWYDRVLGMEVVHRYGFDAESFKDLVGTDSAAWNVRGTNIGRTTQEFYFGVIDYGTGDTARRSLRDRARLPNRGIAGALCMVDDLDRVVSASAAQEVVTEPVDLVLGPWGRTPAMTLVAPHGIVHTVVETPWPVAD